MENIAQQEPVQEAETEKHPTPEEEWVDLNSRKKILLEEIKHGGQTPEDRAKTQLALKEMEKRMEKLQGEYGSRD